jgi:hypothetical protein
VQLLSRNENDFSVQYPSVVRALLADLIKRGLATHRSLEVIGAPALIQCCREHKKRNVTDALARAAAWFNPQHDESGLP